MTLPQFEGRIGNIANAFPKAIIAGMRAGLLMAQRISKREFIVDRSGAPLPVPGPLTNRTGRLRNSIKVREPRKRGRSFVGALMAGGPGVRYARVHELGGRRVGARPYLKPALRRAVPQIENQIRVAVDAAFKKGLSRG